MVKKETRKMNMDFKSIISKLDSMEAPVVTPSAPKLPVAVQLNEDAQLRVLSGRTTYVAEAKKKAEEDVKEEMKVGDKKTSSTGGTIEKTKTGVKHTAGKNYGGDKAPKDEEDDAPKAKKKTAKESISPSAFKDKFMKMVEAKKDENEADAKKKKEDKKKKMAKIMDEGAKPDFLDMDKDGDKKEPMKKAVADKKGGKPQKGVNPFAKKTESKMMPKGKKRPVKESVEAKLSFRDMMKLVVESGGQQQIDPLDKELFAWAQRVARTKLGEGMKAEVYAGMTYERMGGEFQMFDVLSENQK
jgi:hypothetical protein